MTRPARVRQGIEKSSPLVGFLPEGTRVVIFEVGASSEGTPRAKIRTLDGALEKPKKKTGGNEIPEVESASDDESGGMPLSSGPVDGWLSSKFLHPVEAPKVPSPPTRLRLLNRLAARPSRTSALLSSGG